ncbi:MAG TPA: transporter substrate-binding domain-containing protein [Paenalcaligenes sp.]|nr:transporter substrate-binding domain-containing protein [Paenalcaligenes sp.]
MKKAVGFLTGLAVSFGVATAAHAGPRLDQIMDEQVIRVGTPGDYRPFAIKNDDGEYEGHDIDVIEAMADGLNLSIEYVPTSWPDLLDDLQADKFDVAVGGITRTAARLGQVDMLPGYAPFGKVALARKSEADKYKSLEDLNQPSVHVIKNPGGTNEQFVLDNLTEAEVSTHEHNAEIPGLIAEGKGDIMITETFEALHYANEDDRLAALFVDDPLTPQDELGFLLPTDDADFTRVMRFAWDLMDTRGVLDEAQNNWLK